MKNANFKMKKIAALVASGVLATGALNLAHAEDVDVPISVNVNNAINATAVGLNFGSVSAVAFSADGTANDVSSVVIDAETGAIALGSEGTSSSLIPLSGHQVGSVSVTGAAPNTTLNMVINTNGADLTVPHVNSGSNKMTFNLTGYSAYATTTSSASPYPTITAGAFTLKTDAAGDLAFNLGGELETTIVGNDGTNISGTAEAYADGNYQATLVVSVNY